MIQFNLNIDLFYEFELKNDSEVKAIACIEYPVIHIIAKTRETTEEDYDHLDRFIVDTAIIANGISIENIADLTGINPSVFLYRAKELEKQKLVLIENGLKIIPESLGIDFLNDENFEREIIRTRSFLLDGVTHLPLLSYFYKEGKENLITDNEKDKRGIKVFNPAIIPNPPDKDLKAKILSIPVDERANYNIPPGLKDITDFDFYLMTYPLTITLSRTKEGGTRKRLIDCNEFYSNEECVSHWQKDLDADIRKTEVLVAEFEKHIDNKPTKAIQFQNNWGKPRTEISKRVFNTEWSKVHSLVAKQYDLSEISKANLIVNDFEVQLKVDEKLFQSKKLNKKKLIDACIRKRDYLRQNPRTGVWLVFLDIIIADDFVLRLISLYQLLQSNISIPGLLIKYENDYRELRKQLVLIDRFDYLEEIDIYLFLHSRETGFNQKYLLLRND